MGDPLDDWIRQGLDAVPVPPGLRERIGAAAGRRGIWRLLALDAAAALLALAAITHEPEIPRATAPLAVARPIPATTTIRVSLDAAPPLEIGEAGPAVHVYVTDDRMVFEIERSVK